MENSIQVTNNSIFINDENLWDADLGKYSVEELRDFKELARKIRDRDLVIAISVVIAGRIPSGSDL